MSNSNGVMFDGCRESDGTMLEAKSIGYLKFMVGVDAWEPFYTGADKIMKQAYAQWLAAGAAGRQVEWYFAEQPVADFFREQFAEATYTSIEVFYEPYIPGQFK